MKATPATLAGRRVLLTRSLEDNQEWAARFEALGVDSVELTCLSCEELPSGNELARELERASWLAVASRRAAGAVANLMRSPLPERVRVACVGAATRAACLAELGRADLVSPEGTAGSLAAALVERVRREHEAEAHVLVAAAAEGRPDLEDGLRANAIATSRVEVYRTIPVRPEAQHSRIAPRADAIVFASPSAVTGFLNQVDRPGDVPVVTLGPTTTRVAVEQGFEVAAEAETRDFDGIVAALLRALGPPKEQNPEP